MLDEYINSIIEPQEAKPKAQITIIVPSKRAALHTEITPEASMIQKLMEGRKWWKTNPSTFESSLIFEPTGKNLKELNKIFDININDPFINIEELQDELDDLEETKEYKPHTKPYAFQDHAYDLMRKSPKRGRNYALFCEPGTGKSKMAIDRACELFINRRIRSCIIIAPKGVHNQWADEQIPIHCGTKNKTYIWEGTNKEITFKKYPKNHIIFFCINYDALRTKKGANTIDDFLRVYNDRFMIVFDESHLIKNEQTTRWKECNALARHDNCTSRLLLTGTPIAKNLCDEWAQFKILDEDIIGIRYRRHFVGEYCILGGSTGNQIVGIRNLDEFKAITEPYIYRARKKDLAEMGIPEKIYKRWSFKLNDETRKFYNQMSMQLVIELEELEQNKKLTERFKAQNAAVKVLKLQQISNGFIRDTENNKTKWLVEDTSNDRLIALLELLQNDIASTEKVIIWCRFKEDIRFIEQYLPSAVLVHGDIPKKVQRKNINKWMRYAKYKYLIATAGSGGTGLNLQKSGCKYAVYYSNSENFVQRAQSEDRIHRIGMDKTQPVIYYDLVARNTRDIDILANLRGKKHISDITLGDIIQSVKGALK